MIKTNSSACLKFADIIRSFLRNTNEENGEIKKYLAVFLFLGLINSTSGTYMREPRKTQLRLPITFR